MPGSSDISYNIYYLVPLIQVSIAFNLAYLALDFLSNISALRTRNMDEIKKYSPEIQDVITTFLEPSTQASLERHFRSKLFQKISKYDNSHSCDTVIIISTIAILTVMLIFACIYSQFGNFWWFYGVVIVNMLGVVPPLWFTMLGHNTLLEVGYGSKLDEIDKIMRVRKEKTQEINRDKIKKPGNEVSVPSFVEKKTRAQVINKRKSSTKPQKSKLII